LPSLLDLLEPFCDPSLPDLSRSTEDLLLVVIILLGLILVGCDPALGDPTILRRLLDPPIPASELDRCDPAGRNPAEQRADQFARLRQGVDQPPHRRDRLLTGMLFEIFTLVDCLG
jgi:hypothetical protein